MLQDDIQKNKTKRGVSNAHTSLQAVDKCRNCMSQQPILMRKSAENVII